MFHIRRPCMPSVQRPTIRTYTYRLPRPTVNQRRTTTNTQEVKELHSILIEDDFVKQVEAMQSEEIDADYQLTDAEKAKLKKLYSTDLSFPDYKFALNKLMTTLIPRGQTGYGWTAYPQLNPFEKNAMEQRRKASSNVVKIPKRVTLQTFVNEALNPKSENEEEGIESLTSRFKQSVESNLFHPMDRRSYSLEHGITIVNMQPALSYGKPLKPTSMPHLERLPDRWVMIDWKTSKLYVCVRENAESSHVEHAVINIPRNWMNSLKRLQWPAYSLDFDIKELFKATLFGRPV